MENTAVVELAVKMTILDAIEKGCSTAADAVEYMKTEVFKKAVDEYVKIIREELPEYAAA